MLEGEIKKEYSKIETLLNRDKQTFGVIDGEWKLPEFEYLKDNQWEFTEKVDGTNIRVIWDGNDIFFKGKTDRADIPNFLYGRLEVDFIDKPFENIFDESVCLYGEGYGGKIQKGGGNYRQDQGFVLFDVKCGDWWLKRADVEDIAEKLGIDIVPIVFKGTLHEMVYEVKRGFNSLWGNFPAEGLVARPAIELKDRSGHRVITKLKCKDFPNK